jgi:diguanylate cyclase (GGDEF)-like protein/PAS domain S-box-containing protein
MTETNTIRILLIEDNPDEAELVQEMLTVFREFSFVLEHVDTLAAGLERLINGQPQSDPVDVVLLDLNLPDSSGAHTFERLYQHAPWVPVILMTGEDNQERALQMVRQGAQDYLVKGNADASLLVRAIRYSVERKRSQDALRESEERYTLAIQGARDGIWDWDLRANQIRFSPRWKGILGYADDEIGTQPGEWTGRVHLDDLDNLRVALSAHIQGTSEYFENEHRLRHKDGGYRWVLARGLAVRNGQDIAYRMAGSLTDITLQKHTQERLVYDALHDSLTGLPNRALILDRLGRAIEHTKRHSDHKFAVLFLDLDRFKVINDSLGHAFGDKLLAIVSGRLSACLRANDSVARIGGDEFVVLLDDINQVSDALIIAGRIQNTLRSVVAIEGHKVVISASIGVVVSEEVYDCPEDILRDADIAMYHAKMMGKACHMVFQPSMRRQAIARMGLENDLRRALENEDQIPNEFMVLFQPIVSLSTERVVGFEALLRWSHPERGPVKPGEFIPIAEETGLIHILGAWVLGEACKQVARWQTILDEQPGDASISVNVNISGKQFSSPEFVAQIERAIQESGINPASLNLEITESSLLESREPINTELEKIRRLGVNLHVDDFGKGYSSYRYLQNLPISSLKIDSAYVHRLGYEGSNTKIVGSIVSLARSLGMTVIAEGVETEAQFRMLKALDCPMVQGYYISHPVRGEQAGEMLRRFQKQDKVSLIENIEQSIV